MDENNFPLVSIIIPVRNRIPLLIRAIESILSQTYDNYQIIVVDDHSTEDIESALNKFHNSKIKYVKLIDGNGGGAARAFGVNFCKGKLVCFLDSDDEWHKFKLKIQVSYWIRQGEPNRFFSYTDVIKKFPDNSYSYDYISLKDTDSRPLPELIFKGDFHIQTSSYMFSIDLIKTCNFNPIKKHQDWDLLFRLIGFNITFHRIDIPLTIWHQFCGDNVSSSDYSSYSIEWYKKTVLPLFSDLYFEHLFYRTIIFPKNHIHFIRKYKLITSSRLKLTLYKEYLIHILKKIVLKI